MSQIAGQSNFSVTKGARKTPDVQPARKVPQITGKAKINGKRK